ncbi:exodeoxyribonuclease III [Tsukamurella sp. 8F]|uniref:exodeoxyribonuclease III n=1 Tax=unclassified Tsukamurella TaxID=2633480 RepID=UPI0023B91D17|nr:MULTISPECIES: exodeoxyribonuclease III [unclassified Tsukamurella]MDF0531323.1 exodeoxyribonuclease III [Tsukamurella sp. 8J]MDF0588529.1 exodeoxyribonuclease III [Tsukamurella sp. 8F]
MAEPFTAASFNVNGIRASTRRGFADWLATRSPDAAALQEMRCPVSELPAFRGYHLAYDPGTLAGRNGVAVLTREPPEAVRTWGSTVWLSGPSVAGGRSGDSVAAGRGGALARGLATYAAEGRYIEVDLTDRPVTVACLYLPKGGLPAHMQKSGGMRDAPDGGAKYLRKMRFLGSFARQLDRARLAARARGREFLLMGDLNIAHTELDVTRWRPAQKMEGFLPEERQWLGARLGPRTLVDVVRMLHPGEPGPLSWWSWLGRSFENDVGWRIDYHLASPALARTAAWAGVDRAATREQRMSDHAPVVVGYEL